MAGAPSPEISELALFLVIVAALIGVATIVVSIGFGFWWIFSHLVWV